MNTLPAPGALTSRISPPSSLDSSRLIARPRPVPPYLRLVRAVGLLERLEDDLLLVGRDADAGVAHREGDHALGARRAPRPRATSPRSPARSMSETLPTWVNLNAFDSRFLMICCRRLMSVCMVFGSAGSRLDAGTRPASTRRCAGRCARRSAAGPRSAARSTSTATVPDSIFDRSRMSAISASSSLPDEWMVFANSTCFGVQVAVGVARELVGQDQQVVERRAQLVRHVRQELGLVLRGEREL